MSSYTSISTDKLSRLIGTANAPTLADGTDRDRVARHSVPAEGQQSAADCGDGDRWSHCVSPSATDLGHGPIGAQATTTKVWPWRLHFG
jgi:hypothetical protein